MSLEPPEQRQLENLTQASRALGRQPNLSRSSLARYVCIAPTRAKALGNADVLRDRLHLRRRFFARKRGEDANSLVPRSRTEFHAQQAIIGSPDDCIDQIGSLARIVGAGHIRCTFNGNGAVARAEALRGMELFAREVLLIFRDEAEPAGRANPIEGTIVNDSSSA